MRAAVLLGILMLGLASDAYGQSALVQDRFYGVTYRPADVTYRVGHYPHFDLIYQVGTEETAFEIATRLEVELAATQAFIGEPADRLQMPVVVNGYTDRSNGFVSPFPFRQEIEAISIKSDALTTPFPSWPAAVAPHELVHAAHAEINAGIGLGGALRVLGPDWSRVINLTAPDGLIEGAAVYRESQLYPGAGRLNAPLATMTYRAAMLSDDPWSLTQMLEAPSYTRPFDRHYVGGGQLFAYLAGREASSEPRFFHRATRFHHRVPFLGFGVGLWHATGTDPLQLNDDMREALRAAARARHAARGPFTEPTLIDGETGLSYRRPHWVDDSTLVAHAQGYTDRAGFYAVDALTGRRRLISAQQITEDGVFTLAADSAALYFSRYVDDPLVDRQARAEVHRLTVSDGTVERVTHGGRAHAPVSAPDGGLWALPNDGAGNQWGRVQPDGTVDAITDRTEARFEQVALSPRGDDVAVLLNVEGRQRIYRAVPPADGQSPRLVPWLGLAEGAIYDVNWDPSGRYVLFAGDWNGGVNLFALDTQTEAVAQLTNVAFGALEPTVSPDGTRIAFVHYQHERFELVQIPFRPQEATLVSDSALVRSDEFRWTASTAWSGAQSERRMPERISTYRSARYLAPRLVYPTLDVGLDQSNDPLGLGIGVGIAGADPLQRWAYSGAAFVQAQRLWGRVQVQTGRHWLRPRLTAYSEPTAAGSMGIEERGMRVRVGAPVTLERNVHLTQVRFQVASALQQARFINGQGAPESAFVSQWTLQPRIVLGYRLAQNLRDLVPSHGLVLRGIPEVDLWSSGRGRRGVLGAARWYLPDWTRSNTGLSVYARLLSQNQPAVINGDTVLPRGYRGGGLTEGTFATLGAEIVRPITFVDDGLTLLPLYIKAIYGYGFAETVQALHTPDTAMTAIGGGLGVRLRFFYTLDFDLRFGGAYRPVDGDVRFIMQ